MADNFQYLRKASLYAVQDDTVLDLSQLRFSFDIKCMDTESPNNAAIRVYNISQDTETRIRKQFTRIVVQAGYEGTFGKIFDGTIKQFRSGRITGTPDTYLDILAADGDLAYNMALVARSLGAGSSTGDRIKAANDAMKKQGLTENPQVLLNATGGVLPRGKVLFGLARNILRQEVQTQGATWSIQNGQLKVIPLDGYLPDQVVVLNGQTGLIGRPEQTVDGIRAKALINPSVQIGGRVQIDNKAINQTLQQNPNEAPVPYNQWAGLQMFANISSDGIYRVLVNEYTGDTRGPDWYMNMVLLAIDSTTNKVISP